MAGMWMEVIRVCVGMKNLDDNRPVMVLVAVGACKRNDTTNCIYDDDETLDRCSGSGSASASASASASGSGSGSASASGPSWNLRIVKVRTIPGRIRKKDSVGTYRSSCLCLAIFNSKKDFKE
jgi:hypothetical protein